MVIGRLNAYSRVDIRYYSWVERRIASECYESCTNGLEESQTQSNRFFDALNAIEYELERLRSLYDEDIPDA